MIIKELDLNAIDEINKEIHSCLPKGGIVLLKGDLASGKTTLVQSFVASLNIKELVTSPTFSLQQIYAGTIFHYDIYNKGYNNFLEMGLFEELEKDGFHFIEWADDNMLKMIKLMGLNFCHIEIEKLNNKRLYRINNA
jgi:tRNA threonylcarbamoyladenosine biosynthesis protein TsaE